MNIVLDERPDAVPFSAACRALGVSRSGLYERRRKRNTGNAAPRTCRKTSAQPRALEPTECKEVLDTLNSERFRDQPPQEIFHTLLEEGTHLCSISTMHRLLRSARQSGERRNRREPQRHAVPRLQATAPNQVWTWDCSKIATYTPGVYLTLYVVLDLFSRYVLGWMISNKENSALATQLMSEATMRYGIAPEQLTIHQDRGAPMIAHRFIDQALELGVMLSHSRPRVSNDNAMSESQFATLKGQPDWPGRFESASIARAYHERYVGWYNNEHHHSGLSGFTPEQVFTGRFVELADVKQQALDERYLLTPERFVTGPPVVRMPPKKVVINPYTPEELEAGVVPVVNFPTLTRVKSKLSLH